MAKANYLNTSCFIRCSAKKFRQSYYLNSLDDEVNNAKSLLIMESSTNSSKVGDDVSKYTFIDDIVNHGIIKPNINPIKGMHINFSKII